MSSYTPDLPIHAGKTLEENLEYAGMSIRELSVSTGLSCSCIESIIGGLIPITPNIADKLEKALPISATFWNTLESNYQKNLKNITI